ncbi:SusD/RagB family nutrient-binding outer membrane lipoprotein [Algibacter mikhailovii]|uniref:SusD/RagB family nutrient-binding outer membrane lipoprotein n=1 Tax=Algibacter mikhailovii TaxID=425498 RepID=UPI00249468C5|nr:SusD/RagB family nutrient-binding outer membrane lipoprotein [Algibacter mikhailovii]
MKKIYSIIMLSAVFTLSSIYSCSDNLDINTDPLAATSADPNAVFPFVFGENTARKVSELGTRICDVSQYISNTFNSPNRGSVSGTLSGNTWGVWYVGLLGNLSLIKADAVAAGSTSNNVNGIATALMANTFLELTALWEDVPYTEALDGVNFPQPKFDNQETVLNGVVDLCDEAMALIDSHNTNGEFQITPASDMYYGGDIAKWRIFANSLKLRALMMLRSGGANVDAQINATLDQPLMTSNDQTAYVNYAGTPGAQNAMLTIITAFFGPDNESQNVFGPGDPIDELLNGSGDPRWDLWVARNDLDAPGNDIFPDPETSVLSNNIIRADLPDVLMSPDEIDLYKAELALAGFAKAGSADTNYRNGVRNSIKWWGQDIPGVLAVVSDTDIDAYVNGLAAPTANDIFNEQYLAAFNRPILAWNHVRRNKVPVLDPPPGTSISTILKRFTYPPDEIGNNPNTPANKNTDVPMWFENL